MTLSPSPRLVFVDLEGTLIQGSAVHPFVTEGQRLGVFPRLPLAQAQALALLSVVARPWRSALRFQSMRRLVAGLPVADVERAGAAWVEVIRAQQKPVMVERLQAHRAAGDAIYLISGALHDGMQALAAALDLTGGEGTMMEQRAGRYTGRPLSPLCQGEEKAVRARRIAQARGLALADAVAYSDSGADVPLLRLVGHPVAVDPEPALRQTAEREGWPILVGPPAARR